MAKITIDARMLDNSGIGTYLKNVIPSIISQSQHHIFYVLVNKKYLDSLNLTQFQNTNIIPLESSIYSIGEQMELLKKIPKDSELLWVPHYNIPVLYNGKLMVTIHDVFHIAMPEYTSGILKKLYAKYMFKKVSNKADKVITVSKFTMNEFNQHVKGSKISDIIPIYNGIDDSWRNIQVKHVNLEKPYFIYVGNVKPHKNLISLLKAFEKIKDLIPHKLLIVGKKEGFITGDKVVIEYAESMGDRVEFTGHVDDYTLQKYVKEATAMVFPSLYEGFGLPPLEAMSCGCPVIVSDTASIPEICQNAAMYIDPLNIDDIASKMKAIVEDDALRQSLIKKGYARAEVFSWNKCSQQTISIIEEVLDR